MVLFSKNPILPVQGTSLDGYEVNSQWVGPLKTGSTLVDFGDDWLMMSSGFH